MSKTVKKEKLKKNIKLYKLVIAVNKLKIKKMK